MVTWATHWTDWISVVLLNVGFYVDAEKCKVEKFIKSVFLSLYSLLLLEQLLTLSLWTESVNLLQ